MGNELDPDAAVGIARRITAKAAIEEFLKMNSSSYSTLDRRRNGVHDAVFHTRVQSGKSFGR